MPGGGHRRDGMRKSKVAAIARTVLFRRMRTVLIRAHGKGLIATTLNYEYEVRSSAKAFEAMPKIKIQGEMLDLAKHIISTKKGTFNPAEFDDRYESALAELVKAKVEGRSLPKKKPIKVSQPNDLLAALRESAGMMTAADKPILTDDDLDTVALETVRTIDIEKFVPRDSIEWVYFERPHYLMPDDPVGHEAFAVIRDAMATDKVLGVSRLVIGRRERAVVLEPRGEGIVLWTLRFGDEVRPEESYFEDIDEEADPDLVPLVQQLIKQRTQKWSPTMVTDPIQESLLKIISEKKKALTPRRKSKASTSGTKEPSSNVVNIMDALRKSMEAELKGRQQSKR